jgi:hypothetical protein
MVVNRHGENLFGLFLSDDMIVQLGNDFSRCRDFRERFGTDSASSAPFLNENGLTQINAFTADVHVAGTFDERSYIPVTFMTKRTKCLLFTGSVVIIAAFTHI